MKIFTLEIEKRRIHLSDKQWKHIMQFHSNVDNPEKIKEVLLNPLTIKEDKFDNFLKYFYKYDKTKNMYMIVSVKYLNGEGFVITSFYVKKIRK